MYQGEYHGSKKHEPDLDAVLDRAWKNGLDKMMITGGSLEDANKALKIARSHGNFFHFLPPTSKNGAENISHI